MNEKKLIELARQAIKTRHVKKQQEGEEKRGVFVTLYSFPNRELRGCIGFVESLFPLWEAVQRAAIAAAYEDSRFPPLTQEELDKVIIEVSILSLPEKTTLSEIKKGDGVILDVSGASALFLPQVWDELPSKSKFLSNLCFKAGLFLDCWKRKDAQFYKFHVTAFEEVSPSGRIVRTK